MKFSFSTFLTAALLPSFAAAQSPEVHPPQEVAPQVPIPHAMPEAGKSLPQPSDKGELKEPFGVLIAPLTAKQSAQLEIERPVGLMVHEVLPHSMASDFGMKSGDVLLRFNRDRLVSPEQLKVLVHNSPRLQEAVFSVYREGKRMRLRLASEKPEGEAQERGGIAEPRGERPHRGGSGDVRPDRPDRADRGAPQAEVESPNDGVESAQAPIRLGTMVISNPEGEGLLVSRILPASIASQAGVQIDDILIRLDSKRLNSPVDVSEALKAAAADKEIVLHVRRGKMVIRLILNRE